VLKFLITNKRSLIFNPRRLNWRAANFFYTKLVCFVALTSMTGKSDRSKERSQVENIPWFDDHPFVVPAANSCFVKDCLLVCLLRLTFHHEISSCCCYSREYFPAKSSSSPSCSIVVPSQKYLNGFVARIRVTSGHDLGVRRPFHSSKEHPQRQTPTSCSTSPIRQ